MKTVLVTGAHGFLGRHCAQELARAGWYVLGAGLGDWRGEHPIDFGIADWKETAISLESLASFRRPIDLIVHCAGSASVVFSLQQPLDDYCMTVATTAAVLEYIRTLTPETRLVYPSSAAVYGARYVTRISEDSVLAPVSPYGAHKQMAEMLCASYASNFGVNASVIRFFSLYGIGLRKQLLWDACVRMAAGGTIEFFGKGDETRDWLHVRDAAALVKVVAELPTAGHVINGGSGSSIPVREMLELVAGCLGGGAQVAFNGKTRDGDPRHLDADITKAQSFGWSPSVKVADGVAEYVNWFQRVGL